MVWTDPDLKSNPKKLATLIGISSFGGACGYSEYPDVFGRVTHVLDWITSKTRKYNKPSSRLNERTPLRNYSIQTYSDIRINKCIRLYFISFRGDTWNTWSHDDLGAWTLCLSHYAVRYLFAIFHYLGIAWIKTESLVL